MSAGCAPQADTFLRLSGFGKGAAWLNGFALGRYWEAQGPQHTLYVPAPVLKKGANELLVFEVDGATSLAASLVSAPDFASAPQVAEPAVVEARS